MRTEDDIVSGAPLRVVLGGEEREVKLLVIRESREWRRAVAELLASLPQWVNVTTDEPDQFGTAMNAMLKGMPDTVIDLFFQYAKDLDREEIEGIATEGEIKAGFSQIVDAAFPLLGSLGTLAKQLGQ